AFYCGRNWTLQGNVIDHNYLHDIYNPCPQRNRAFMLDDGASGLTMTNNGGGGQPVSMKNIREVHDFARKKGLLIWFDTCRIFENAFYIKAYEPGYADKSLQEIVKEIMSYCDVATISFKKIYAHNGGGIFINKNSPVIGAKWEAASSEISALTTVMYGNGFNSYSGTTADTMIEAVSGLLIASSADNIGSRIAQVHRSYLELAKYGVPVVGGGHALYIAADQMFPKLSKKMHPAEFLHGVNQAAYGVGGCGLGYIVYGYGASMDSLRYAFPREVYSQDELAGLFSLIGQAYQAGIYQRAESGVTAQNYVEDGFFHFRGKYVLNNRPEFVRMVNELRGLI
ncbi:MAG: beta-eliminating lyase-related protein, partial [Candidatus Micrarchaeota archaeon]|nr:beta-eliminating lyase-related protein [Candidatus Micrarchaeota archaeon]